MSPNEASVIKSSPIRKIGWYLEQYCILTLKIPLFLPSVWRRGLQHKKFQEKGVCSSVQSIVLPLFVGPPLKISFGHIFVGLFLDSPWKVKMLVLQSCLTRCYPMDCIPPGSSVHGISQARIVEWVAIAFSRHHLSGSSSLFGMSCPAFLFVKRKHTGSSVLLQWELASILLAYGCLMPLQFHPLPYFSHSSPPGNGVLILSPTSEEAPTSGLL